MGVIESPFYGSHCRVLVPRVEQGVSPLCLAAPSISTFPPSSRSAVEVAVVVTIRVACVGMCCRWLRGDNGTQYACVVLYVHAESAVKDVAEQLCLPRPCTLCGQPVLHIT